MTDLSISQLQSICPRAGARVALFINPLNDAMNAFEIVTARRQAAFLSQCAHESAEFVYMRELASGEAYEGRSDLGNTNVGDGPRYKGGALIEITGRYNYTQCGRAIGVDLANEPELIVQPAIACKASAWWWKEHGCNELADSNSFGSITHKVNGGYNGLDARLGYWLRTLKTLAAI